MNDIDDRLRELFRRRAEDPPSHSTVPPSLHRRARRRIALNAVGVGAVVVVLAAGTAIGLRSIAGPGTGEPAQNPTTAPVQRTSGPTQTTLPSGAAACTAGQLRATGTFEGAAGSRLGAIRVENLSDHTCTLRGRPAITLLDQQLHPIQSGVSFVVSPPGWKANAAPRPPGWPVVTVEPGRAASSRVSWSNWCPQGRAAPLWRVGLPSGGSIDVNGLDGADPPPCNGAGLPSTVEVGPFEPARQP